MSSGPSSATPFENGQSPEPRPNSASPTEPSAADHRSKAARQQLKSVLITYDFAAAFEENPTQGCRVLADLLRDEVACEARGALSESVHASDSGQHWIPGGVLAQEDHFLQELVWIALGVLATAVTAGLTNPERIARLTAHPAVLRLARETLMSGLDALQSLIQRHGAETWHWLRDEIVQGRLVAVRGESVVRRYVAAWRRDQPYDELIVGDSARSARLAAAQQWLLPDELISVSFVDPD